MKRFWSKVNVQSPEECWPWEATKIGPGYGQFRLEGKMIGAHRMAYILEVGEIPEGHEVCHSCDNPSCVNPAHLFVGTSQENSDDMKRKDRQARGEGHGGAKLTPDDVRAIREDTETSHAELGRRYGIMHTAIYKIRERKTWKHIA